MLKDVLGESGLTIFATFGLVVFVAVFVGITVWALTRRQRKIDRWSRIPLNEDDDPPVEERDERGENGAA